MNRPSGMTSYSKSGAIAPLSSRASGSGFPIVTVGSVVTLTAHATH